MSAGGVMFTLSTLVTKHDVGSVYVITVVPGAMPVTTPEVLMVPMAVTLLAHAPPEVADVSVAEAPTQTDAGPVIAPGSELTVIVLVCWQPVVVKR
jgi:hypothetical protein